MSSSCRLHVLKALRVPPSQPESVARMLRFRSYSARRCASHVLYAVTTARLRKLCTARSSRRRRRLPSRVAAFMRAKGDLSRHMETLPVISATRCHRRMARRPRPLSTGLARHSAHLRHFVRPACCFCCAHFFCMTEIRSMRHVRRFHLPAASHRSGCFHRCITSTSFRSHRVSTCCTSSLVRPGFQHERSKLLRKSAAHSSSAICGAERASAVFFLTAAPVRSFFGFSCG